MDTDTTHGNVKETDKQNLSSEKKLLEQFKIEGTPFTVVKFDNKWFLTMGKYRLSEPLGTREEAEAEAKDASWIRIMQIMKIVIQEHEEEKQLNKTIERQKQNISQHELALK